MQIFLDTVAARHASDHIVMVMFFRSMDQRYGRVSTIITTNLDYPQSCEMFGNKPLVDALLDRLQHHNSH